MKRIIFVILLLVRLIPAEAEVIRSHDPTFDFLGSTQDGFNLTVDAANGIEWLDFTLTAGRSLADVAGDTALSDWRPATASDFEKLGISAGVPSTHVDVFGPLPAPSELAFLASSLGITRSTNTSSFAVFNEPGPNPGEIRLGGITTDAYDRHTESWFAVFDIPNDPQIWLNQSWLPSSHNPDVGVALVRDTALIALAIDIKPGSDPNTINPESRQKISVAVLSSDIFDATQVDVSKVAFGIGGAPETHGRAHIKDVDADGDADLLLHFSTQETGIACGDTEVTLTGETFDGHPIVGTDTIVTTNCP